MWINTCHWSLKSISPLANPFYLSSIKGYKLGIWRHNCSFFFFYSLSMDLETMFKETYVSQPTHLQESCLQPSLKDVLLSSYGFFKDFHHIDQFHHVNISSSNTIQTPNFDAFDNFTNTGSSPDFDFMIVSLLWRMVVMGMLMLWTISFMEIIAWTSLQGIN